MYALGNSRSGSVPTWEPIPTATGNLNGCALLAAGNCKQSIADATADLVLKNPAFVVNPLSAYLLGFYTPNNSHGTGVTLSFPNANSSKNPPVKVDYHISDHHSLRGS